MNFIELDEDVYDHIRNYQKAIVAFFNENFTMQTVFIETSISSDKFVPHAYLDCVGVPNDLESEFDIELYFRKSLLEDDSEWGTHKKLIDTKTKKGHIAKCIPRGGSFNYVHVDFNATGGFAHVIEDSTKYTMTKALEVLGGAIGHELVNLNIPMR